MTEKQLALLIAVATAAMNVTDLADRTKIKQALWEVRKEIKEGKELRDMIEYAAAEASNHNA